MKLRTQILLFLFLFALLPLLAAVTINLPLVLERLELFYHKAHLQNLRADFRNLDQHLASRQEMARTLAKLPEPGLQSSQALDKINLDQERARYIGWVNRLLGNLSDVRQILFLNSQGQPEFWLAREQSDGPLQPTITAPDLPPDSLIQTTLAEKGDKVLVSPISLSKSPNTTAQEMSLHIAGPISLHTGLIPIGAVVMTIDMDGMANAYRDTLWVLDDGRYLGQQGNLQSEANAFRDFSGLQTLFEQRALALWEDGTRQVLWLPMFPADGNHTLWVGRTVDPSPLASFKQELTLRVLGIIALLVALTFISAQWVAHHAAKISRKVTDSIRRIVENNEMVSFDWQRPNELHRLGLSLNELSIQHHDNVSRLRAHALALEASNRYKSEFLANVSHELRTPLNSILLLSKLLAAPETPLPAEQANQARVIHEASRNLKTLIDNILDMSRIEAGKAAVNLQRIELVPFLQEIHAVLSPQFLDKGLHLELIIEPGAPEACDSDPDKVGQILRNFLSNSVKFTEQGGAVLRLHGSRKEKRFSTCISVEDSGIGIPLSKQEKIFTAFQQADGATNRRYGGSGLGLTISRQLARLLGGDIFLRSEPGQGSMFTLGIPDVFMHELSEERPVSHEPDHAEELFQQPPPKADFTGYGILVVDDNLDSLLLLAPLLEGWGMQVCAAADSQEAAEALQDAPNHECGMVLINCGIAPCQLRDTIRQIGEIASIPRPPVIALVRDKALAMEDADAIIETPFDPQQLHDVIESLIKRLDRTT